MALGFRLLLDEMIAGFRLLLVGFRLLLLLLLQHFSFDVAEMLEEGGRHPRLAGDKTPTTRMSMTGLLRPGIDIRVVGNDNGEKLQMLFGYCYGGNCEIRILERL